MEVRVVGGLTLLVGLALVALLIATTNAVTSRSFAQAADTIEAARSAFYVLVTRQAAFAVAQTRLITELPVFRAHISDARLARDGATLDVMVDGYRQQLGAQFSVLTDGAGTWTSEAGWPAGATPPAGMRSGIAAAAAGRPGRDILSIGGHLLLLVSEPVRFADEVLGTFTVGYALDDAVAEELARVTHCEINLIAASQLSGSSLAGAGRLELSNLLASGLVRAQPDNALDMLEIADHRYIAGSFPVSADDPADSTDRILLLQDWQPTRRFLDGLRSRFYRSGAVIFVTVVLLGVFFSRRVTRPFQDVAAAARDIATGNWTRQVPVRGSAESMTMATAFNEMTTHLRHWHQEAHDRSARLEASYQRFSSVMESARDAVISTDQNGAIAFWSRSAGTMFGYGEEETIGQALTRFVADSDRDACNAAMQAIGPGEAGAELGRTIEVAGLRRTGAQFPVEVSVSMWQSGGDTHFTAVVRDITERKQLQDEIQRQRLRVFRATMRTVQDIVNNLLNGLQLVHLDAMEELPPDVQTLLDSIIQEAAVKLKALGDLDTIVEREMTIGQGIEYPGSSS